METRVMTGVQVSATLRRRLRRVVFVLVVLATLGAGQELLFRWLFPIPEVTGFNRIAYQMLSDASPKLRESMRRGLACVDVRFVSQPDGFDELHRLNIYGFRGPDFIIDPPVGRRRVLVIGDSVAEGQGAPEAATIAAVLERRLAALGVEAEVLNLGVVAANLPRVARLTRDATALLRPSDVVLVLYANDLPALPVDPALDGPPPVYPRRVTPWWIPRVIELGIRLGEGRPIYRRWPRPVLPYFPAVPDPGNPWSRGEALPVGIDSKVHRAMVEGAINPWLVEQMRSMPAMLSFDYAQGLSPDGYLGRIDAWCLAVGARLVVAYVPFCGVVDRHYAASLVKLGMDRATADSLADDPVYRKQVKELASVCGRLGIAFVETTDALIAAERLGARQFWEYDTHPRPAGYGTIGSQIAEAWHTSAR